VGRASWNADAVRDDVREYVVVDLHDEAAVLVTCAQFSPATCA
jgi:hypothetical protein